MGGVTDDILSFNISLRNSGNNEDNILKYYNFDFEVKKWEDKYNKTNIDSTTLYFKDHTLLSCLLF